MSKVRILIIEDELLIAEEMSAKLGESGYLVQEIVDNGTDARRALEMYQLDIVLVDIKLRGEEDGISIANFINSEYDLPLIFVTSLTDPLTVKRAVEAKPYAYLVKPYNQQELLISIDMALFNFENRRQAEINPPKIETQSHYIVNQHVFVKDKHRFERVEYEDILWLKAESSYVSISTQQKNYLLTGDTLGSMLGKISEDWMLRVHRSYAVNVNKVNAIDGNALIISDHTIPIGKNYRGGIKQHFRIL